jgi:predicted DNA-binding transcriptional regulator AlpA
MTTERYLSLTEIAQRLGITTGALAGYKLPGSDAYIGRTRGWKPETIDQWNAERPDRGAGGGRPRKRREE